jgi:hypothetical protein
MNIVCIAYAVPSGLQRGRAGGDNTGRRSLTLLDTPLLALTVL